MVALLHPCEYLEKEHQHILGVLETLQKITTCIAGGVITDRHIYDLLVILDYIKYFADEYHHGKEEDILFPLLEALGIPNENGPIATMLNEHRMSRQLILLMTSQLERFLCDTIDSLDQFYELSKQYIALMHMHIEKENNALFLLARQFIDKAMVQKVIDQYAVLENALNHNGNVSKVLEHVAHLKMKYTH